MTWQAESHEGKACHAPQGVELYRIDNDFYETKDFAANPETTERIDGTRTVLLTFMKQFGDPIYEPQVDAPAKKKERDKRARQRQ